MLAQVAAATQTAVPAPVQPPQDAVVIREKSTLIKTLEACIDWLNLNEEVLEQEAIALIDDRLADHAKKSEVFLIVAIQKRMDSLVRWLDATDILEEQLFSEENIKTMASQPSELRKTLELLESKIDRTLTQVMDLIKAADALPNKFNEDEERKPLVFDGKEVFNSDPRNDPFRREQTRSKLKDLIERKRSAIPVREK